MSFGKKSAFVLLGVMALGLSASMMVSATNEIEKVKDQTAQVAEVEKKDPSAGNNLSSDENKGENGQGFLFLNGDNVKKVEGAEASENGNSDGRMFLGDINAENGGAPEGNGGLSTGARVGVGLAATTGAFGSIAGVAYACKKLKNSASGKQTQQQGQGSSTENQVVNNVDPVMPTEDPNNNPGVLPEPTKFVLKSGLDLKTILIVVGSVILVVATAVILYFVYKARKSKVSEKEDDLTKISKYNKIDVGGNNVGYNGFVDNFGNENDKENDEKINNIEIKNSEKIDLIACGLGGDDYTKDAEELLKALDSNDLKGTVNIAVNIYKGIFESIKNGAVDERIGNDPRTLCDSLINFMLKFKGKMREIFNVPDYNDEDQNPIWVEVFGGQSNFQKLVIAIGTYMNDLGENAQNLNDYNQVGDDFDNILNHRPNFGNEGNDKRVKKNDSFYGNPLINGQIGYKNAFSEN